MSRTAPVYSMTGYGKGEFTSKKRKISAELKSVNNRFFEFQMRGSHLFDPFEPYILEYLKKYIKRGSVTLFLNIQEFEVSSAVPYINFDLLKKYRSLIKSASRAFKSDDKPTLPFILGLPEVLKTYTAVVEDKSFLSDVLKAVSQAVKAFNGMRLAEGKMLINDLKNRAETIKQSIAGIEKIAPARLMEYEKRLREKVIGAFSVKPDAALEQRIVAEVTLMADKMDISEELTRFKSHTAQFAQTLQTGVDVGKKLNFIMQEMHREINTISSKAGDGKIIGQCVAVKEEIEKIREQVQNLE